MALTPRNRQEDWYQEMINASTGNYLPSITAQDEGKVLTVENDGSWGVENVPSELPAVTASDKDKFLHTNDSTGAVEWADVPTELPSVSGTDEGKVLTVNNSGVWVAQEQEFVVHLTPTSESGGMMDKSNAEILAAYTQGKRIMFDITVGSAACRVQATLAASFEGVEYPSFNAYGIDTSGTTIINLYVDPSVEESYTFTMNAVEIGGGSGGESDFVRVYVEYANSTWSCEKTWQELSDLHDAGKCVFLYKKQAGQQDQDIGVLSFNRGSSASAISLSYQMPGLSISEYLISGNVVTGEITSIVNTSKTIPYSVFSS